MAHNTQTFRTKRLPRSMFTKTHVSLVPIHISFSSHHSISTSIPDSTPCLCSPPSPSRILFHPHPHVPSRSQFHTRAAHNAIPSHGRNRTWEADREQVRRKSRRKTVFTRKVVGKNMIGNIKGRRGKEEDGRSLRHSLEIPLLTTQTIFLPLLFRLHCMFSKYFERMFSIFSLN